MAHSSAVPTVTRRQPKQPFSLPLNRTTTPRDSAMVLYIRVAFSLLGEPSSRISTRTKFASFPPRIRPIEGSLERPAMSSSLFAFSVETAADMFANPSSDTAARAREAVGREML